MVRSSAASARESVNTENVEAEIMRKGLLKVKAGETRRGEPKQIKVNGVAEKKPSNPRAPAQAAKTRSSISGERR